MVGVCLTLCAALHARAVACAGFGLDAVLAIGASMVVLWQLTGTGNDRQHRARRLIRTAFFALALSMLVHSNRTLDVHRRPATSLLGLAWLGRTCVAMLALACGHIASGRNATILCGAPQAVSRWWRHTALVRLCWVLSAMPREAGGGLPRSPVWFSCAMAAQQACRRGLQGRSQSTRPHKQPNKGVQATASSLRSFFASASGSA